MKYSAVLVAAAGVVAVSAQGLDISKLPTCALTCLSTAVPATGCSLTDYKCLCSNQAFVSGSTACIQKGCSATDAASVAKQLGDVCAAAGVPISGPASSSAAAPSSSAAATTSEAAPSSSAAAPSSSAAAPSSSAAAPSSYVAPSSSAVATTVVTSAKPSTTAAAPSSYSAPAGNVTSAPVAPTAPPSNGASGLMASGALAVVGVVAAFFF